MHRIYRKRKALTLTELIVVMVIFGIIAYAAAEVITLQIRYSTKYSIETAIQQTALLTAQHLKHNVRDSAYVDIEESSGIKRLKLYNKDKTLLSTYTFQNQTFAYQGETVSDKIQNIIFEDKDDPSNTRYIKLLKTTITAYQPNTLSIEPLTITTIIYSRHTYTPPPAHFVYNATRDVKYNTINEAINGIRDTNNVLIEPGANPGDEIRVIGAVPGFDGVFEERVAILKPVVLKGGYSKNFTEAERDITNHKTTVKNTRSVINVFNPGGYGPAITGDVTIDGFTIIGLDDPAYSLGTYSIHLGDIDGTIDITNNIFPTGHRTIAKPSGTVRTNINIENNTFSDILMTQRPIDNPIAVALWCELAGNIVIRNNTFNEAGLSCVALWSNDFISLTIENNTFTANLSGSVTSRAIYLEVGMVGINATIRNNTFANINSQYNPCIWIYTGGGGGCTIDNITIDSNRFTNCKDISSFSLSPAANTSITNNVFDSASLGGIICASAASHTGQTLTITGNTVGTIDHTHFYGTVTENNNNPPS